MERFILYLQLDFTLFFRKLALPFEEKWGKVILRNRKKESPWILCLWRVTLGTFDLLQKVQSKSILSEKRDKHFSPLQGRLLDGVSLGYEVIGDLFSIVSSIFVTILVDDRDSCAIVKQRAQDLRRSYNSGVMARAR